MKRTRLNPWVLGAVALVGTAAGSGATFALWNDTAVPQMTTLTAGTLDILPASAQWYETSADVAAAPHQINPASFLVRQGDTVEARYVFETELTGDNMLAGISLGWPEPDSAGQMSLPEGVTGTYQLLHVTDPDTPQQIGQETVIGQQLSAAAFALTANNTGRDDRFELRVKLDFAGLTDVTDPTVPTPRTDLGTFNVTLEQLRSGDGFS